MKLEQVLGALREGGKITNSNLSGPQFIAAEGAEQPSNYLTLFGEGAEETVIQVRGKSVNSFTFGHLSNEVLLGDDWSIVE
jgi:hypothetical protein